MAATEKEDNAIQLSLIGRVHFYIKDYLDRCNFEETSSVFEAECQRLDLPISDLSGEASNAEAEESLSEATVHHVLDMFDNVYEDAFFKLWDDPQQVPHVPDTSGYLKINFRLHIYFCCRKIAEHLAPVTECLQNVREFLDREGTALSHEQEFIHYFALPFVTEPQQHPTFKLLFQSSNWNRLRNDVECYLQELRQSDKFSSELVKLVLAQSGAASGTRRNELFHQILAREQDAAKTKKKYSQLMASHQQLRKDYQKLIAVTKELTSGLEMVAKASSTSSSLQSVQWDSILGNCSKIYPELFPPQTKSAVTRRDFPKMNENILQSSKWSTLPSPASPTKAPASASASNLAPYPESPALLSKNGSLNCASFYENLINVILREGRINFQKIKEDLAFEEASRRKVLLLQALRWLLTKSANGERHLVIEVYLQSDLLGFLDHQSSSSMPEALPKSAGAKSLRNRILAYFLPSDAALWETGDNSSSFELSGRRTASKGNSLQILQQACVSRLVNAMASLKKGRDYLGAYDQLIEVLIDCLLVLGTRRQRQTAEMIVATLQKLSLKCLIRKKMIERGIIEWLITYLKEFEASNKEDNSYGLEYSTALFMNLCLHKSAKEKCIPMAKTILETLLKLVSTCSKQILPYVNGSLYSLLSHAQIAEEAREIGLDKKLEESQLSGDRELRKQINFILEQIHSGGSISSVGSSEETGSSISDDEDDDSIDEDIDIEDEIDANDPVVPEPGELSGPFLLESIYAIEKDEILYIDNGVPQRRPETKEMYVEKLKTPQVVSKHKVVDDQHQLLKEPDPISASSDEGVVLVPADTKRSSSVMPEQPQSDSSSSFDQPPAPSSRRASTATYTKETVQALDQIQQQQVNDTGAALPNIGPSPPTSSTPKSEQPLNPAVPLPPVTRQHSRENLQTRSHQQADAKRRNSTGSDADECVKTTSSTSSSSRGRKRDVSAASGVATAPASASRPREKRPISMSFPYSPLSTSHEEYQAVFAPKPRVTRSPPRMNHLS